MSEDVVVNMSCKETYAQERSAMSCLTAKPVCFSLRSLKSVSVNLLLSSTSHILVLGWHSYQLYQELLLQ
jgi:hypothetical protein